MTRKAPLLVSVGLACLAGDSRAQPRNLRFQHISVEQGLSQATVHSILQDRRGFMWFGTEDGLNRYDGYTFTVFKHDDLDATSLTHNFVRKILEGRDGAIWVGTRGGLNRWDPLRQTFRRFQNDPADPASLGYDRIKTLYEDRAGFLWVGTDGGGLDRLEKSRFTFSHFRNDPADPGSLSSTHVTAITQSADGAIWVGTRDAGLNRWDPATGNFVHYRNEWSRPSSLSNDEVSALYVDRQGRLWVGTQGGLNRFDPASQTFRRFTYNARDDSSLSSDHVQAIYEDDKEVLWIGTARGLNALDPVREIFVRYQRDPLDLTSLNDEILDLYQDRGGVLWVGTGKGLSRWDTRAELFEYFEEDPKGGALSSNTVTAFYEASGDVLWVGTFGGGLNRLDRARGKFTYYRHDPANPASLSDDRAMSLLVDRQGVLWVGTFSEGLNRLEKGSAGFKRHRHEPADPTSLSANGVAALYEDREGLLWVATFGGGLNRFDRARERFIRYRHDPKDPKSLSNDRVQAVFQDSDGVLWIGTDGGGLNRFDAARGSFTAFRNDPDQPGSLSSASIHAIAEDRDGTLWIGTERGLNGWARADRRAGRGRFAVYKERHGLPNEVIYGVLPDLQGNLWLSTNNGISRFNLAARTFRNYGPVQGLQGREFNFGAYHRGASGRMYFGGANGFNAFFPERVRERSYAPPVVLTGFFKLNEKVKLEKPPWETETVEVGYRDHPVTFEFAALDYSAPEQNRYAYKLEGFNDDWIDLGTARRATYTNLDAGDYTLRVKAAASDGAWNDNGVSLQVLVHPAPWQTWWAYGLYALIVAGALLAYSRAQARKRERTLLLQRSAVPGAGQNPKTDIESAVQEGGKHDAGVLVHGRYRVLRPVGRGGMGAVYEARDEKLGNRVALKQTLVNDPQLDRFFEREAKLLAGLRHPCLPVVSDYFIEESGQFLVMQFIPGTNLSDLLKERGGPFPVEQVLGWGDQVLRALEYLHGQTPAIIHRDIKPANLKLTEEGQIVLLDFGLAKGAVSQLVGSTAPQSLFGFTPQYAPPEQILGSGTDPRSDLYSLAATVIHLLTNVTAADALRRLSAVAQGERDPLRTLRELNPAVPPAVDRALVKALSLNPDQRFPSAGDLRAALETATGEPPRPQESPSVPPAPKKAPTGRNGPPTVCE